MFRPGAGVSTAILLLIKTNRGGTDQLWVCDGTSEAYSLDHERNDLLPGGKLGPSRYAPLADNERVTEQSS